MIQVIKTALDTTGYKFAHFAWAHAPAGDYGTYAEDSQSGSIWADGRMQGQTIQGRIDFFTRDDSDTPRLVIQGALDNAGISYYLNAVLFEDDTRYIHYQWVFGVT